MESEDCAWLDIEALIQDAAEELQVRSHKSSTVLHEYCSTMMASQVSNYLNGFKNV